VLPEERLKLLSVRQVYLLERWRIFWPVKESQVFQIVEKESFANPKHKTALLHPVIQLDHFAL